MIITDFLEIHSGLKLIRKFIAAWYILLRWKLQIKFQYSLKFLEKAIFRFKMLDYNGFYISTVDRDYSTM